MKFPNINNNDNFLIHKVYIFLALFIYQFLLDIIASVRKGFKVQINKVLDRSIHTGLYAVLGYSIYVDLRYMSFTKDLVSNMVNNNNKELNYLYLTLMITVTIALMKFIKIMFDVRIDSYRLNGST
jgi:hypothetical protein